MSVREKGGFAVESISFALVGLIASLCVVVVKQKSPDIALVLSMATCTLLLLALLPTWADIQETVYHMTALVDLSDWMLAPVMKTLGIALVTKFSADLCRDAKENGIAGFVELTGVTLSLLVALPLLNMVLELIGGLL